MAGEAQRRYIDEITRFLFAPLLRPPKPGATWRLLSMDGEQGLCLSLENRGHVLLIELEDRDEERDCYARTERFNVCVRRQFEWGVPTDDADRRLIDAVVAMVQQREAHLPVFDRPAGRSRAAVREVLVDKVLMAEGRGHYYINPYVGCAIGCPFCYVAERADLSRRLEGLPSVPWGRWVDVKVNAPELLREELKDASPGLVRMSPIITDPYQPVERRYRITRGCLEALLEDGRFAPVILTRAARVMEDLDLLRQFDTASVGFSIPSDDDRYRRMFEPGADPVEQRIEALAACREAGLHTFALIQPVLPMNVERLVAQVAPLIQAVRVDRMHVIPQVRDIYEANDLLDAASDAFFERTRGELLRRFEAAGVRIDELDDMVKLIGLEA